MQHQILIASYHKDFPWLRQCLRSLDKFARGFGPTVVAVPNEDFIDASELVFAIGSEHVEVKIWNGPGFGRAQDAMMSGDILCPDADYFWLLGSDCLAIKPFTPDDYMLDGKPVMLYHSWAHIKQHAPECYFWRAGVEDALGWPPEIESMRRLPLAYPREMMEPMREYIAERHGVRFTPYVHDRVNRVGNHSESNIMGEWARRKCPHVYTWHNLDHGPAPKTPGSAISGSWQTEPILQCWSHGGFDRPHDILKVTPRQIITETLGSF